MSAAGRIAHLSVARPAALQQQQDALSPPPPPRSPDLRAIEPATRGNGKRKPPDSSEPPPPPQTWFCFMVVRCGGVGLDDIHIAQDPFAFVTRISSPQQRHQHEDVMQMERETEIPFSRRSRLSPSLRRASPFRRTRPQSPAVDLETLAREIETQSSRSGGESRTEIARISRGESSALSAFLPNASGAASAAQNDTGLHELGEPRLAMAMGPVSCEEEARVVQRIWKYHLTNDSGASSATTTAAAAEDLPARRQQLVVRLAEWGELVAAWFRLGIFSDLVAIFDANRELRYHVLQQTTTGELWLVEREKEPRAKDILLQHGLLAAAFDPAPASGPVPPTFDIAKRPCVTLAATAIAATECRAVAL